MVNEALYKDWLEQTRVKLIAEYERLNFRASGRYANSLEPFIEGNKLGMLGARHAEYMSRGRGPTSDGKKGRLYGVIKQWIQDKNITPRDPKMTRNTLAWLIARKIDMQGYSVSDRQGVIDNVITDEWVNELFRRVSTLTAEVVVRDLQSLLKSAA